MKLIPELQNVLQWNNDELQTRLGISRATFHRWNTKGLPPMMSIGNEQRLKEVVICALDELKGRGDHARADAIFRRLCSATRNPEAYQAWSLATLPVYTHDAVLPLRPVIAGARDLWTQRCDEYARLNGDSGSCVVGAGFYISFLPDNTRKPRAWIFLPAHSVTPFQGSLIWEDSQKEVHSFLLDNDVQCSYEWGKTD